MSGHPLFRALALCCGLILWQCSDDGGGLAGGGSGTETVGIMGVMVDEEGAPVKNAVVTAYPSEEGEYIDSTASPAVALTDSRGRIS